MAADLKIVVLEAQDFSTVSQDSMQTNIEQYLKSLLADQAENIQGNDLHVFSSPPLGEHSSGVGGNLFEEDTIVVLNKSDLLDGKLDVGKMRDLDVCVMSCETGEGMDHFTDVLTHKVRQM